MLTDIAQKRYDMLMEYANEHATIILADIAELWGVSKAMVSMSITMFKADGLAVPEIILVRNPSKKRYAKKTNYVDNLNMGDPSMPLCPNCEANGKVGRGFTVEGIDENGKEIRVPNRVHLVHEDGETFCLECGYDAGWENYKRATERLAGFSRHRVKTLA